MRKDDSRCIAPERSLDHLSRMHLRTVDGALEQLHVLDQSMPGVEVSRCKDFPLHGPQHVLEKPAGEGGIAERLTSLHPPFSDGTGRFHNPIRRGDGVASIAVAHVERVGLAVVFVPL